MLGEVHDLDEPAPIGLVSLDESALRELVQEPVDVGLVVRQNLDFDALRPVLEPSFAVSQTPEPLKEQSAGWRHFGEDVVCEKARLEHSHARHQDSAFAAKISISHVRRPTPKLLGRIGVDWLVMCSRSSAPAATRAPLTSPLQRGLETERVLDVVDASARLLSQVLIRDVDADV